MTLPVDTNVFVAGADRKDPDHDVCRELLAANAGSLTTTPLVIAETGWLLDHRLGAEAEARFCELVVKGDLVVHDLTATDWERVTELVVEYGDHPLGAVDSSIVAMAERLNLDTIATLDHRHFHAVRPKHMRVEFVRHHVLHGYAYT